MLDSIIGQESRQICASLYGRHGGERYQVWHYFGINLGGDKMTAGWIHIVSILSCDGANN